MKKVGLGTRLMALLLALTMLVSYVPSAVWAASVGDTFSDPTDVGIVAGSLDTSDTISWPIKIYDYLNDGMLFEYSSAHDYDMTEHGGGAYGGGEPMPMIRGDGVVGVDYTSVNGYFNYGSSGYTEKHAFVNWGNKGAFDVDYDTNTTEVKRSIVQPVKDESPMYMHLEKVNEIGSYSKTYGWISNFAQDDQQYYSKEDLRYMVLVYKTNEAYETPRDLNNDGDYKDEGEYDGKGHALRPYWSVSDSSYDADYTYHSGDIDISDVTDNWGWKSGDNYTGLLSAKQVVVDPSSEWTYMIFDMKTDLQASAYSSSAPITANNYGIATNWDKISGDVIAGVGIGAPLSIVGEAIDISHVAYFPSEELADYFGERALMFDRDPGEYMGYVIEMTHSISGGTAESSYTAPTVSKGLDLTKSTANGGDWDDAAVVRWYNNEGFTVRDDKSHTSGGYYYARISETNDTYLDTGYVKYGSTYYNVSDYRYITVVYRTNVSSPKLGFWLERGTTYAGKGFNGSSYTDKRVSITGSTGNWVSVVYDLAQINTWDSDYNTYFNGKQFNSIGIMFPGFTNSSQYMDIAYVEFSSSASAANTFATNAKNYLNNFTVSSGTSVKATLNRYDGDPNSGYGDELWNTGSNQAFTMLYGSVGGGWSAYDNDTAGGENTWTNGYYSYQIGKSFMSKTSTINNERGTAAEMGYPVSKSIFLLNTYNSHKDSLLGVTYDDEDNDGYADNSSSKRFDMSQLELGYTLYNTMKDSGVMTAGLLESSQATFIGTDGKEYTVMQYKDDTIQYIANLLKESLVIPERDFWGYNYNFVKGTASAQFYEDVDGDGKLDEYDEDKDKDGRLDVAEDLNGNGRLDKSEDLDKDGNLDVNEDANGNGKLDLSEDLDGDGNFDAWEDLNYNGLIDPGEDKDGDGKLDVGEDVDYDGRLDVWEDKNYNDLMDPGEDIDGDGKLDVNEDLNGNGKLDVFNEDTNKNGWLDEGEDLNGNGRLDSEDFNCDGDLDLGEDKDGDRRLDAQNEDVNGNGKLDLGEDIDNDGNLDVDEDLNGDGGLDVAEDRNDNGELDKRDLASALRERLQITFPANMDQMRGDDYDEPTKGTTKASLGSKTDTVDRNISGKKNGLIGPYLLCQENIKTFYDAAYYLLHNLFVPGSYNQVENDYQYLVMNKAVVPGEDSTNKDAYVFDAGFTSASGVPGTVYDDVGKRIYQTTADDKWKIYYDGNNATTLRPFLPVNDEGEGMDEEYRYNGTPYFRESEATTVTSHGATYSQRNYNYVMTATGEFVFHMDDDLFFDFEGDDDVYMFINGELVLDIGGAHSITKVGFNMNDYVKAAETVLGQLTGYAADMSDERFAQVLTNNGITESKSLTISSGDYAGTYDIAALKRLHKLNLVDGQSYPIDFYYMERHGWGANMRIATNIVMTDPKLHPGKTAYQGTDANGNLKEVVSGGLIDDSKPVDYSFSITNGLKQYDAKLEDSNTKLYRLGFQDMNIGVDMSAENGLQIFGKPTSTVFRAESDTTLDITGLNGIIELDGVRYRVTVEGNFVSPEQKVTETLTIPASSGDHTLVLYQHNSTELFKDVKAQVKLGSGATEVAPKVNSDGQYPLTLDSINNIDVKGVRVTDQSGGVLDPSDLTITVDGYASQADFEAGNPIDTITIRVSNQQELMNFLTNLQDPQGQTVEGEGVPQRESALYWGAGLWKNGTVTISGMWYTLSEEEQAAKVFNNTVKTSAYQSMNSPDQLVGYASHRVFTPGEPMYYQWAGHTVHLGIQRFWDDMLEASIDTENPLYAQNVGIQALKEAGVGSAELAIVNNEGGDLEVVDNYYNNGQWATFPKSTGSTTAGYHEIYYKQIHNWENTYVYYWSDANNAMTTWPGVEMKKQEIKAGDGKSIYRAEIPADAQYIIFNNGTANAINAQTGNIALPSVEYDAVTWNSDNRTLEVHYTSPGMHMFYVKVTSTKTDHTATVPVSFYVTDTKDKTYVLDYGLTTEDLNANGTLFRTDELLGSHVGTTARFMGITTTKPSYLGAYSTDAVGLNNINRISFVSGTPTAVDSSEDSTDDTVYMQLEDGKLYMGSPILKQGSPISYSNGKYVLDKRTWFTPEKIMDAEYDVWMGITVHSADATYAEGTVHYHALSGTNTSDTEVKGEIDIGTEVQMYKKITILPATVVYYEDDFMDITYEDDVLNMSDKTAGKFVHHGAGSGELTQGVDQNVPYGQDTTYQGSGNSQMSGHSMTTINISDNKDVGSFSFKGTGFEIVSRTNAFDSASFVVEVFEAVKNANGQIVKKDETADKRLPVITEFTSADVVCKHDHHTPNGYCSYCGNKVSHSYVNGVCTVCNSAEVTYYLVGYINGVDQNETTEYEFVDGKLVTTFDQDSYVMVMDNVGNHYWTNGYPGDAATSAELFNVGKYSQQMEYTKNKLLVPGGVEVTLNLMDNGEGGLVLSYFQEPVNLGERTLFFDISTVDWSTVQIYYWSESNSMMVDWPGVDMLQYYDEDGNAVENVFYYTVPSDATKVIFNENGGRQTDNLTIPGDHFMYVYHPATEEADAHWSWTLYGVEEEEEVIPTTNTVYFENSDGWEEVWIYAWTGDDKIAEWPGVRMQVLQEGGTRYVYEVPLEYTQVIFNNGKESTEPGADKTGDQSIHGDEYLFRDDAWYDSNGMKVETGTKLIYFKNTYSSTPKAHYWINGNTGSATTWPGVDMTQITGTDYYYVRVDAAIDRIVFNDGSNQTDDLAIDDAKPTYEDGRWTSFVPSVSVRKVYFDNATKKWDKVYVYFWSDANGAMTEWSGVEMAPLTDDAGETVYYADIPADADYIKFTNGTVDKNEAGIPIGGGTFGNNDYFTGDTWVSYQDQGYGLYFRNTNGWSEVYAYYWSSENDTMVAWKDVEMSLVEGEEDLYFAKLPLDAEFVIFHNGNNGTGNQTDDLDIPGNGYVYNTDTWYPLGEEPEPVEIVYYLRGSMNDWGVSTPMTKQEDGTYAVTLSLEAGTYEYKGAIEDWTWSVPSGMTNASVTLSTACDVTFVLDVTAGTITATGDGVDEPAETVYYLRGSMNNWDTSTPMTKQADGTYAVTISLEAGTYEYKAAIADWTWSVPAANASITVPTACDVTFVLNVAANTVTANIGAQAVSQAAVLNDAGTETDTVTTRNLYYENVYNWAAPKAYILHADGSVELQTMKKVLDEHYLVTVPSDAVKVAFTENEVADPSTLFAEGGSAVELSADLDLYTFEYVWSGYDVQESPETVTVYFDNTSNAWSTVHAYTWNADGNTGGWPGNAMTKVSGNIWSITVPVNMTNIIFNGGDGAPQTADLSIPGDGYLYDGTAWKQHVQGSTYTVFFDNTGKGWEEIYVHYWRDNADGSIEKNGWPGTKMEKVTGNVYKVEVPLGITNVLFTAGNDGPQTENLTIQGDGYIYGTSLWKDLGGKIIYFANPEGWDKVYMTYGNAAEDRFIDAPGVAMDKLDNGVWSALVPDGNDTVNFYSDKYVDSTLPAEDDYYQDGSWYAYTGSDGKEIQQVPVIRVDDLEYGYYIVEVSGMPQYEDDTDWMKILDLQEKIAAGKATQAELDEYMASVTKDTYLYIDGVRIFQPLNTTNGNYSAKENSAAFKELRTLILDGQAAVGTYIVNKTSIYTGNYSWTENRNGDFVGSQIEEIDDYLLIGPNNETYINSNLNDQAVIFYVKEAHMEGAGHERTLQIGARALDAGLYTSGESTGLYSTIYQGQAITQPDGSVKYGWKPVTTLLSGTEQYYEIDYEACPYHFVNGEKVYQVALSVRQGMVSFTSVKTNGLTIMEKLANESTYKLSEGIYTAEKVDGVMDGGSEDTSLNFGSVAMQLSIEIEDPDDEQPVFPEEPEEPEVPEQPAVTDPGLSLSYPSLSFEDEIFYNVYYTASDVSDVVEMGLMLLPSYMADATMDDAIGTVPGYQTNGTVYMAKSESIAAANMGDTMYFKVYAKLSDGTYAYSGIGGYNAKAYANTVLNGNYADEMKALVVAMVNYGAEAQLYFGHNTGALVNSGLTAAQKALVSSYDGSMMDPVVAADSSKIGGFVRNNSNFKSLYPSVSFDGAFSINFYCTPAITVDDGMTLYYWDAETLASISMFTLGNATGSMKMTESNGQYWGCVDGIAAKDMDKTYYVSCVFQHEGQYVTTGIIPYSLGSYCESIAAKDGDAQQAFAQATAVYGYYAKKYFASIA